MGAGRNRQVVLMIINLSPTQALPGQTPALSLSVDGDTLTIDGTALDFAPLDEGDTLPADAVEHDSIVGDVTRQDGEINLTVLLPIGPGAPEAARFPGPINAKGGPVKLPPLYEEPNDDD